MDRSEVRGQVVAVGRGVRLCRRVWPVVASSGLHVLEVLRIGHQQRVWVGQGLSDREVGFT